MNFKRVLLCALFFIASILGASAYNSTDSLYNGNNAKVEKLIDAIVYVESRGNVKAKNGTFCGPMQISPSMVKSVNQILKKQGSSKRYTLQDRFNMEKSKEMFRIFNKKNNPEFDMEKAIRSWNGGLGYKIRSTQGYYNKVMAVYKK